MDIHSLPHLSGFPRLGCFWFVCHWAPIPVPAGYGAFGKTGNMNVACDGLMAAILNEQIQIGQWRIV